MQDGGIGGPSGTTESRVEERLDSKFPAGSLRKLDVFRAARQEMQDAAGAGRNTDVGTRVSKTELRSLGRD